MPTIADGEVFVGTADTLTVFGLLPAGKAAPLRQRLSGALGDPGIVSLLGSLTSRDTPGNSSSAVQAKLSPSQLVLPLLTGSAERFAKDIVFAADHNAAQGTVSRGELAMDNFDLLAVDLLGSNL